MLNESPSSSTSIKSMNVTVSSVSTLPNSSCYASCASSELLQVFHSMPTVNTHNDLKDFITCLSQPLPITFRLRQLNHTHSAHDLSAFLHQITNQYHTCIQPISLYPSQSIITFYQSSPTLCKDNLKQLAPDLHHLLHQASISGLIARQDVGSMLPIQVLSTLNYIKLGSKILDLCASPGSKTMQALEVITYSMDDMVQKDGNDKKNKKTTNSISKLGRLISNDINAQRLLALQEAVQRSGIPSTLQNRIVFTNYDASVFPTPTSGKLFDCVLADVPCSGDGTIRKDKTILPGWMPTIANTLHSTQLGILKRALELVRVGGIVAYSTCSLNPVENEAVVGAALDWANQVRPSISLVTWPDSMLPLLKRRPGISTWRVAEYDIHSLNHQQAVDNDKDEEANLIWLESFEKASMSQDYNHLPPTLWPKQKYKTYSLNNCIRLWPQDQNTGGFFLAVLCKYDIIP